MKKIIQLTIIAFLLSSVSFLSADDKKPHACAADAKKICSKADKGEIFKCLVKNESKLSSECKGFLDGKRKEYKNNLVKNCKEDAPKVCKGVKPGEGRVIKCLKEKKNSLSASCKNFLFPSGKNSEEHVENDKD